MFVPPFRFHARARRPTPAQEGNCGGGIIPDVHLRYALGGAGDPSCDLLDIMPIGSTLNTGYYAIAMNPHSKNANGSQFLVAASSLIPMARDYQARRSTVSVSAHWDSCCRPVISNEMAFSSSAAFLCPLKSFRAPPPCCPRRPQAASDKQFPPNKDLCAFTQEGGAGNPLKRDSEAAGGVMPLNVRDMSGAAPAPELPYLHVSVCSYFVVVCTWRDSTPAASHSECCLRALHWKGDWQLSLSSACCRVSPPNPLFC